MPLLVKSPRGNHVIDLDKVEQILAREEAAAVEEDARLPAWAIVREEAVIIMKLGVPMFVPNTALAIMVGHVTGAEESAEVLAAFNLSNMVQSLFVLFLVNGVDSAVSTLCAQAFGGKRMVEFWLFCQAALIASAAGVLFVLAVMLSGASVLEWFGQDPAISALAGAFLAVSTVGVPFSVVYTVVLCVLLTQNITLPSVVSSAVSWSVSCAAAYLLAYHTSLGYLGVAMAAPICSVMKTLTLTPVVLRSEAFARSWPGWKPAEAMALVPTVAKLGLSSAFMVTFQNLSVTTTALLAGLLSSSGVMITASNIYISTIQLSYMPLLGVMVGGAIRIGNALGAGQARRAALLSRMVVVGTVAVALVITAVTGFAAEPYASAFTPDQEVVGVAVGLLRELLAVIPFMGFTLAAQFIMRACGKQLLNAKLNFATMLVVGVPLSWLFGMELRGGVAGLWFGNLLGLILFAVLATAWLYQLSWEKFAHEAKHNTHLRFKEEERQAPPPPHNGAPTPDAF
ncbi:hypothetical protein PybrP1_005827 [[Pythium] brassicae (nom. inval.)]|nr:hypothetical protein PybrP1_005827 [[Pythium] brassicae (nom. inval.)]